VYVCFTGDFSVLKLNHLAALSQKQGYRG